MYAGQFLKDFVNDMREAEDLAWKVVDDFVCFAETAVSVSGMAAVRYCSFTNDWVDFVCLVPYSKVDEAEASIRCVMDKWYELDDADESSAYRDVVEAALKSDGIPFAVFYRDSCADSDNYETIWGSFIERLNIARTIE